jgi:hypothetical protein
VFEVNPLQHDEMVKKEAERFEHARILKKITDIQKKKGVTNLKRCNDFNSLLKEEELPEMVFNLEKKSNKETFDNFDKKEKGIKGNISRSDFNKTVQVKSSVNDPLLNIEVNIDDNNKIEKLEIYKGDDPIKISENFCKKHGLSEEKKLKLQKIIQDKLIETTEKK